MPDARTNAPPDIPAQRIEASEGFDERGRLWVVPGILVSSSLRNHKRWIAFAGVGTVLIHGGFAAFFLLLIDVRDLPDRPEKAIPVEIVTSMPEGPKSPHAGGSTAVGQAPAPTASASPPSNSPKPPPFVAPPPETMKADARPVEDKPATLSLEEASKPDRPAASAPAPAVLSAQGGSFPVREAAPSSAASSTSTRERDAVAAKLAQALPMDVSSLPSTFRAVLSAQGSDVNAQYKGIVFGRLQRAHQAMEEARRRHLHGRVIVSFGVDEEGHPVDLKIAGSSGMPAVDELAIEMVREAEPFPPPPPGTTPVFTQGLIVGDDEE